MHAFGILWLAFGPSHRAALRGLCEVRKEPLLHFHAVVEWLRAHVASARLDGTFVGNMSHHEDVEIERDALKRVMEMQSESHSAAVISANTNSAYRIAPEVADQSNISDVLLFTLAFTLDEAAYVLGSSNQPAEAMLRVVSGIDETRLRAVAANLFPIEDGQSLKLLDANRVVASGEALARQFSNLTY